jgi:eukaryotic-like serine/threonine-protein kinase
VEGAVEKASATVEQVGKYVPIAELGRGGMATAYLTSFSGPGGFNKLMVVKRLRPALAAEPDFLRMFLDEARLAARIDHPNIVHTSEIGYDGTNYFIAMEFVDGQPLENVIRRNKQQVAGKGASPADIEAAPSIPLNLHLHILTKVLEGLDSAHDLKDFDGSPLNVVHRDVSPHNVMVTYDGHIKLLDFGIAKAADSTTDTRTGFLKGKCAYMAPEQFGGEGVNRRADLFSVGIMLWQAITGRRLWRGLSDTEIFARLAKDEVPSPRTVVGTLDEKLEQICMKALATDQNKRFASAAEFQGALEDYIATKPELRASPRDISKLMQELFAKERAKIQSLIEDQVNRSKRSGEVMSLAEYFGNSTSNRSDVEPLPSSTASPPEVVQPIRRSSARLTRLTIAAVGLIGLIAIALVAKRNATATAGPAASTSVTAAATTQLTVRVQPPTAKVTFDGVGLNGSPPSGGFPLDNAQHTVHVEAVGFLPKTETLLLDSTRVTMDVTLDREPAPAPSASTAGPEATPGQKAKYPPPWRPTVRQPRPPPPSTTEATPTVVTSPPTPAPSAPPPPGAWPASRVLDKSDPWAEPAKP